ERLVEALENHQEGVALGGGHASQGMVELEGADVSSLLERETLQEGGGHRGRCLSSPASAGLAAGLGDLPVAEAEGQAHSVATAVVVGVSRSVRVGDLSRVARVAGVVDDGRAIHG